MADMDSRFSMVLIRKILRGATSCALFAAFGLGAILLSPLVLLLGSTERCQPLVRCVWTLLVWLFVHTGLMRFGRVDLPKVRGMIVVANHPSLIDVVLLTVLMPHSLSVAKPAVGLNPFMGVIARSVSIPGGAESIGRVAVCLEKGWNVVIFPEGTRSPFLKAEDVGACASLHPFRRGAAQLALRTGAPIVCVGIRQSRRTLAKHQPAWDMGAGPVEYAFCADSATVERPRPNESLHMAACRLTAELERRVKGLLA